jgi:hypothetical protein
MWFSGLWKRTNFSTKSLYRFLTNRGMPSRVAGFIWKCKIPLRSNSFSGKCSTTNYKLLRVLLKGVGKGKRPAAFVMNYKQ